MSNYVIIVDSSCDLNAELRAKYDIADYLRGVLYFPDGHEELISLDWDSMTPEEYYNSMKSKKSLYKTAAPPTGHITETFEKYLSQGQDIVCMCLSSGLSATYHDASMVATELMEKYPERKIVCIDSLRYSTALALLDVEVAKKRLEGATLEEVVAYAEAEKTKIHQMGSMNDLFFLQKVGRISGSKAFFGNLIGLNVMADFNEKGISEVIGKVKGKKDAFNVIVEYAKEIAVEPEKQTMFIAHSNRKADAEVLEALAKEVLKPAELIVADIGMSCGASIGPGLCALYFKGEPISAGNAHEREVADKVCADLKKK